MKSNFFIFMQIPSNCCTAGDKNMESKHIVNVNIYGAYHIGHQQLTRIKEKVTGSHGLETIEIDY